MSDIKAIVIRGDFTESEFTELVALIRSMDDARPDGHFEVIAVDRAPSGLETAERVIRRFVAAARGSSN